MADAEDHKGRLIVDKRTVAYAAAAAVVGGVALYLWLRPRFPPPWKKYSDFAARAAKGDKDALCNLGLCYVAALGVERDVPKGIECLRNALAAGSVPAKVYLGRCYASGIGVPQDPAEAYKLISEAAAAGDVEGECSLGECRLEGWGGPIDEDAANLGRIFIAKLRLQTPLPRVLASRPQRHRARALALALPLWSLEAEVPFALRSISQYLRS